MALKGRPRAKRGRGIIAPVAHLCHIPPATTLRHERALGVSVLAARYARMKADPSKYEAFKERMRYYSAIKSAVIGKVTG